MKLVSFKDKKVTRRKMILISLGVITIVGISLLFYKTFASFSKEVDLDNDNVLFGFYNGETKLMEMPQKGNLDNLVFERAKCDNGANVEWDEEKWAPLVVNLAKTKTRCILYFAKAKPKPKAQLDISVCDNDITVNITGEASEGNRIVKYEYKIDSNEWQVGSVVNELKSQIVGTHTIKARVTDNDEMVSEELEQEVNIVQPEMIEISGKQIPIATCKDGLYKVEHNDLKELDKSWNKTEYRYAGAYPDNYVEFNNEKWQIIGLVNVKTKTGVEQRLKIIKTETEDEIAEYYAWDRDRNYTNNWTTSKLKDMLNGIYYNSESGKCYPGIEIECDFSGSGILQKGLDDTARKMIDSEVIWNLGGWNTTEITADIMYEKERGTNTGSSNAYPAEWTKENDGEYHNGIGLMYASDYGYAVGGKVRNVCLNYTLENYRIDCTNNWLNPVILVGEDQNGYSWFLTPDSSSSKDTFKVDSYGNIWSVNTSYTNGVRPVGFLLPSVIINDGDGSYDNPYLLSVQ